MATFSRKDSSLSERAADYQRIADAPLRSYLTDAYFAVACRNLSYTERIKRMASAGMYGACVLTVQPSQWVQDAFDAERLPAGEYERTGNLQSDPAYWIVRSVESGDEYLIDRKVGVSLVD